MVAYQLLKNCIHGYDQDPLLFTPLVLRRFQKYTFYMAVNGMSLKFTFHHQPASFFYHQIPDGRRFTILIAIPIDQNMNDNKGK